MLTRLAATILTTIAALASLAATAFALPGESHGLDPYGIPVTDTSRAADPIVQTVAGLQLSPLALASVIVATAAIATAAGYLTGTARQRRLALR